MDSLRAGEVEFRPCLALNFIVAIFLALGTMLPGQTETRRYLYMSTPDGAQVEGRSGTGILIFDIENGHKFVRRIHIPIFQEGLRGFTGSLINHAVYYSTTNHRLGAFDLEAEKVLWENTFAPGCCDRSSITMDGKKIYAPTGFWYTEEDAGFVVINAQKRGFHQADSRGGPTPTTASWAWTDGTSSWEPGPC